MRSGMKLTVAEAGESMEPCPDADTPILAIFTTRLKAVRVRKPIRKKRRIYFMFIHAMPPDPQPIAYL